MSDTLGSLIDKLCTVDLQRNQFMDEIDQKVVEIVSDAVSGEDLDSGKHIQRKHKTY